jgi:restriction system protein
LLIKRPERASPGRPPVYEIYSGKSQVIALILCILFGLFGVHYFYVGRVGMGLLYLFTVGFFGIGWLIDIIRIAIGLFRDRDGYYLRV